MATIFEAITDDFVADIAAIRSVVTPFGDTSIASRTRIAAANSATLLIAATFEEFAREMARGYAKIVVGKARSIAQLPPKMASTAWRHAMENLAKTKFNGNNLNGDAKRTFQLASSKFSTIYEFCSGDLSKDIYGDLIHNENNMRPGELNRLFKISGFDDVCKRMSDKRSLVEFFGSDDVGVVHGKILNYLDDFFERHNTIAHSLNSGQSSGLKKIENDLTMFESLGRALFETLNVVTVI